MMTDGRKNNDKNLDDEARSQTGKNSHPAKSKSSNRDYESSHEHSKANNNQGNHSRHEFTDEERARGGRHSK